MDNAYRDPSQSGLDLILGLGATGFSCARFLSRQQRDIRVADSRLQPPFAEQLHDRFPQADVSFGEFEMELLDDVARVIVSPGIVTNEPIILQAQQRGIEVISDIELFALSAPAPVIGITGSNGKSTVTSWVSHVLSTAGYDCRIGGNLGTPALDLLDTEIPDFYVLELSSFQLERTSNLHLKCGAILNIGTDHLDHHGSLETYQMAKWQMLRHCETAVLYAPLADHEGFASGVDKELTNVIFYGDEESPSTIWHLLPGDKESSSGWLCRTGEKLLPVSVLKLVGHHNHLNALAVLAIATCCEVDWSQAVDGLTSFPGLPHRMQWIGENRGVTWINDSKGTNVDATTAAISSLTDPLVLIAGGDGKGADFSPLATVLGDPDVEVRAAILIGEAASDIKKVVGGRCPVYMAGDMDEAVIIAADKAVSGDVVLLSPACASFDMFDNYMQRGEAFSQAWRNLS